MMDLGRDRHAFIGSLMYCYYTSEECIRVDVSRWRWTWGDEEEEGEEEEEEALLAVILQFSVTIGLWWIVHRWRASC